MGNRARYKRLIKLLSKKDILKNDPYGVAGFVKRLREEVSQPNLANNTINNILDKITRDGTLPEDVKRVFNEIRFDFRVLDPNVGNYSKSEVYGSNINLWPI